MLVDVIHEHNHFKAILPVRVLTLSSMALGTRVFPATNITAIVSPIALPMAVY